MENLSKELAEIYKNYGVTNENELNEKLRNNIMKGLGYAK